MNFPIVFQRAVAANTPWTIDALPTTNSVQVSPVYVTGNGILTAVSGSVDNGMAVRQRDTTGNPVRRLAVGYSGPTGAAAYLGAELYVFDRMVGVYLKTHDLSRALRLGRITYFDLPAGAERPVVKSNMEHYMPGGLDLVLIVQPPPASSTPPNGTYYFGMAPDIGMPETPNADDEANGMQVVTFSDTVLTSMPYGPCRWLWCQDTTTAHTMAIVTADGDAVTLNCPATAGKIPVRAKQIKATGTTATAGSVFAAY